MILAVFHMQSRASSVPETEYQKMAVTLGSVLISGPVSLSQLLQPSI
jgi:hypothetical protein